MKAKFQVLLKFMAGAAATGSAVAAHAATTPPDFTQITSAVDFSSVITAIMSVASTMVVVYVAWRGAKLALRAVKGL
ncbi:hypothetical protein [Burkholderia cenocepacia]|uniref:hypothetical protein n=1 Tax=Burkholderia cenocepacia TaxID=95486 RepID=UPI002237E5FE|nr:hypothetical protein [Burkholderia cenocepacia]MCW5134605.1 hypothetical protein [Burkholderia cenocepacia]